MLSWVQVTAHPILETLAREGNIVFLEPVNLPGKLFTMSGFFYEIKEFFVRGARIIENREPYLPLGDPIALE